MLITEKYVAIWCTSNCPASCTRHTRKMEEEKERYTNADMVRAVYKNLFCENADLSPSQSILLNGAKSGFLNVQY